MSTCPLPTPVWAAYDPASYLPYVVTVPTKAEEDAAGRAAWDAFHTAAEAGLITEDWLKNVFRVKIPGYGCTCLSEWDAILKANPFRPSDQFAWSVEIHNSINAKLKKPSFTLDAAKAIYLKS